MIRKKMIMLYKCISTFIDTFVSFITMCLFSSITVARKVGRYKQYRSRDAFLLGNGPSLKEILDNKQKLKEILNGDSIVMNYFANSEFFKEIRPKFYILLDPVFFEKKSINESDKIKNLYDNLHEVDWKMTLFLYGGNVKEIKILINNENISLVKYNATKIIGYRWFQNLCYKFNLGLPSSKNVIIPALLIMINLGYNKVYLYGAEFSWTKTIDVDPRNNKVFLNDKHFYVNNDVHYYDKGWYMWYLIYVAEMLNGVYQVEKYAKYRNVKIINRTKGSFIDAFEYENPDNIK